MGLETTIAIISALDADRPSTVGIYCPWLQAFPEPNGFWLSVLAVHDANQRLFDGLAQTAKTPPHTFAAVLAVDVLRTPAQIISALQAKGVAGVINLPSASFIDGESGEVLHSMGLGIDREIEFLTACGRAGLRIAGVVNSKQTAQRCADIGAEFLIAHDGPPTRARPAPARKVTEDVRSALQHSLVRVLSLDDLLRGGASSE